MRFALSAEQREFGAAVRELLAGAGVPAAARAWGAGDHAPGLAIWRAFAKLGVTALAVPESDGGLGAGPVDLVVACEELGRHPVPGRSPSRSPPSRACSRRLGRRMTGCPRWPPVS